MITLRLARVVAPVLLATGAVAQPDLGPNVLIFDPSTPRLQERLDEIYAKQEKAEFGPDRFALLFRPGNYDLDVKVGFYTHIAGLGPSPDDVAITGAVRAKATWRKGNATCNFWRSVENLSVIPTLENNTNIWAVSQGVSMRRTHVKGDMNLWDGGWSSGGFLADSLIDGTLNSGSQQQWLSRNAAWGAWKGGNWNMVFVGTTNPPSGDWPEHPYTVVEKTPVIREKPFLFIDDSDRFAVMVPALRAQGSQGISWSPASPQAPNVPIPIDAFFLAHAEHDNAASINAALASGKHLILTPGIYHLGGTIRITRPETVVLGLGYPTLVADTGVPAMAIADVDGVSVAGILFEASEIPAPTLLQVGEPGSAASHAANPTVLSDIFCRVGGAIVGRADCLVTIHSNDVVGDNFWLWRADHGTGAKWHINHNRNGLIVHGDNVTIYGLFVEHCHEYQTIWNGDGGRVYMYQSEMPYDPPDESAWSHDGITGYASYKIADRVKTHEAWGVGIYCVFWDAAIIAHTAIEAPIVPGVNLHHKVTIRLNGKPGSGIRHIINSEGPSVLTPANKKAQLP